MNATAATSTARIAPAAAAALNTATARLNANLLPVGARVMDMSTGSRGYVTGAVGAMNAVALDNGTNVTRYPAALFQLRDVPRGNGNGSAIARLDAVLDARGDIAALQFRTLDMEV